jgi:hypothetical protein
MWEIEHIRHLRGQLLYALPNLPVVASASVASIAQLRLTKNCHRHYMPQILDTTNWLV